MRDLPVPPYVWTLVGMGIGAIIGWAVNNQTFWVGIGTVIGGVITAILYAQPDHR